MACLTGSGAGGFRKRVLGDDAARSRWNPLVWRFYEMRPLRQTVYEDDKGDLNLELVHKDDATGERQRLTMRLDTPPEEE